MHASKAKDFNFLIFIPLKDLVQGTIGAYATSL